jgi:predicted DNA-binding protein
MVSQTQPKSTGKTTGETQTQIPREVIQKIMEEIEDCADFCVDYVYEVEDVDYGECEEQCLREISEEYNVPIEVIKEIVVGQPNEDEENEYYEWW